MGGFFLPATKKASALPSAQAGPTSVPSCPAQPGPMGTQHLPSRCPPARPARACLRGVWGWAPSSQKAAPLLQGHTNR